MIKTIFSFVTLLAILIACDRQTAAQGDHMTIKPEEGMAFVEYLSIDTNVENVKWELFGTPEWSDTLPGPTDFVSIIVSGSLNEIVDTSNWQASGTMFVPQNSNRDWLSERESRIFAKIISSGELPTGEKCRKKIFVSKKLEKKFLDSSASINTNILHLPYLTRHSQGADTQGNLTFMS